MPTLPSLPPTLRHIEAELLPIDREQAFLLFATFCGDVVRTAAALGVRPESVSYMADSGHWNAKLAPIINLHRDAANPGDIERAINRAVNYVQAHRLRMLCERLLRTFLTAPGAPELLALFATPSGVPAGAPDRVDPTQQDRARVSLRPLADLAAAMERAHLLSYAAVGDTVQERVKAGAARSDSVSATALHTQLAAAMQQALADSSPRAAVFDAQLAAATEVRAAAASALPTVPTSARTLVEPRADPAAPE